MLIDLLQQFLGLSTRPTPEQVKKFLAHPLIRERSLERAVWTHAEEVLSNGLHRAEAESIRESIVPTSPRPPASWSIKNGMFSGELHVVASCQTCRQHVRFYPPRETMVPVPQRDHVESGFTTKPVTKQDLIIASQNLKFSHCRHTEFAPPELRDEYLKRMLETLPKEVAPW